MDDAVAFAEGIVEDARRACELIGGPPSVPAQRRLNLARAFLWLRYPIMCCGRDGERCERCPMRTWDLESAAPLAAQPSDPRRPNPVKITSQPEPQPADAAEFPDLPPEVAERGRREGWW